MTSLPSRLPEVQRRRLTLVAMCVAQFMILLDVTIVNIALPSIQHELHVSPDDLEWVVSGYALSLAACIPLAGALGDRYGRKRLFLVGLVIFGLGSAACALSTADSALITFRICQGAGGAIMSALTLSLLTEAYPRELRGAAIALWAGIGGLGFGAGPVAGGILLTVTGWSSVFWVNVPVAVLALLVTAGAVRESRNETSRRLDVPGVLISAAGLVALTFGLIESSSHPWSSWLVSASVGGGVVALAGFVYWERHASSPMLPVVLLKSKKFTSGFAVYTLSYLSMTGALFYVTLLFQNADGWSVLRTGLSWLCMNIPFLIMAQFGGRLQKRYSPAAVVIAGCVAAALGAAWLSLLTTSTPFAVFAVSFALMGAGYAMAIPAITSMAMSDAPPGTSGAASGILNSSRQIGASVGLAVMGTVGINSAVSDWTAKIARLPASARAEAARQAQNVAGANVAAVTRALGSGYRHQAIASFVHGYQLALVVGAACLLAAAVLTAIVFVRPARPRRRPDETLNRPDGSRTALRRTGRITTHRA